MEKKEIDSNLLLSYDDVIEKKVSFEKYQIIFIIIQCLNLFFIF